ncbi:uncharacterized protein [Hyperolius riggenbachi]|uniref:uncharacterized protein isoform X2 n=1 Tax=Hyperolius riggenbachi TaxID=752182 RepID=UPI0035A30F4B
MRLPESFPLQAAPAMAYLGGFLLNGFGLLLVVTSVAGALEYVQSGCDITGCNMRCPENDGVLELYRTCGGRNEAMLELLCHNLHTKTYDEFRGRLQLNASSGCWTLQCVRKEESCAYITEFLHSSQRQVARTDVRVLDPVLIYNISSTSSRLGEDIAVTVQFSGEESHVTWELDGGRLPERYRLIDDNRTLIIPSVQRDDAERTFRVRVTNPVSEDSKNFSLKMEMQDKEAPDPPQSSTGGTAAIAAPVSVVAILVVGGIIFLIYRIQRRRRESSHVTPVTGPLNVMENGYSPVSQDDSLSATQKGCRPNIQNGCPPITHNGCPPITQNGCPRITQNGCPRISQEACLPTGQNDCVTVTHNGCLPVTQDGCVTVPQPDSVPNIQNASVPDIHQPSTSDSDTRL